MKLAWLTIPLALALAGAGWYCVYALRPQDNDMAFTEAPWLKHPVTAKMAQGAANLSLKPAADFTAKDYRGNSYTLSQLVVAKPVVLIFIKKGCPCSLDAEPLFNKLYKIHGESVSFIGIIGESDPIVARNWAQQTRCPFPVLLDPTLAIAKSYQAERSVYTVLVNQGQRIEKMYPGYWADMLTELSSKMAKLTETKTPKFDPEYAPKIPTSGCSLF